MSTPHGQPPRITVEPDRSTPAYEQVRQQIADLITAGVLAPGARLPPVRQLAGDLGLAPGTVARAYAELQAARLVVTRRGGGTIVGVITEPAAARAAQLSARVVEFVRAVRRIGATDDETLSAVRAALAGH